MLKSNYCSASANAYVCLCARARDAMQCALQQSSGVLQSPRSINTNHNSKPNSNSNHTKDKDRYFKSSQKKTQIWWDIRFELKRYRNDMIMMMVHHRVQWEAENMNEKNNNKHWRNDAREYKTAVRLEFK